MVVHIMKIDTNNAPQYMYLISSRREFEELCAMEMRYIFGKTTHRSYHLTNDSIDISRSTFIKGKVTILYCDSSIDAIRDQMIQDKLSFKNYKISFAKYDEVPYNIRLSSMRKLGFAIAGAFAIKNPEVELILTKIDDLWLFGLLETNPNKWKGRRDKPFNYSHSLDIRIAKALINIAINSDFATSIIDPCCGIGTVVIEGRMMGVDVKGFEINPLVKQQCNKNLHYYGLDPDVKKIDMLQSTESFDVAILDLPYGHSSIVTIEEQIKLIIKAKEMSSKSIIIAMKDISGTLTELGIHITDSCLVKKSNVFSRYIFVCN